jgi:hypothetical protein
MKPSGHHMLPSAHYRGCANNYPPEDKVVTTVLPIYLKALSSDRGHSNGTDSIIKRKQKRHIQNLSAFNIVTLFLNTFTIQKSLSCIDESVLLDWKLTKWN